MEVSKLSEKILIIDDEKMITDVVSKYLEKEGFEAFKENDGQKGLEAFYNIMPDLVILDRMLPEMSGEEICKEIRRSSRIPIIMLTAKVEESELLEGLDMGADDYMTKPFSAKELIARVRAIIRRVKMDPVPLFNVMEFNNQDLVVDMISNEVKKNGTIIKLTPSEYKILLSMIKYPNKTFSREELIFIALGSEFDGYDRIIDTHVKKLRNKIETDPKNPHYIKTVHGVGYKFSGGSDES